MLNTATNSTFRKFAQPQWRARDQPKAECGKAKTLAQPQPAGSVVIEDVIGEADVNSTRSASTTPQFFACNFGASHQSLHLRPHDAGVHFV